jgi:hypothetical protein
MQTTKIDFRVWWTTWAFRLSLFASIQGTCWRPTSVAISPKAQGRRSPNMEKTRKQRLLCSTRYVQCWDRKHHRTEHAHCSWEVATVALDLSDAWSSGAPDCKVPASDYGGRLTRHDQWRTAPDQSPVYSIGLEREEDWATMHQIYPVMHWTRTIYTPMVGND